MKRQVIGVRRSSEEIDQTQTNESKRIKLLPRNCNEDSSTDTELDTGLHEHSHTGESFLKTQAVKNSLVHEICQGSQPHENGTHNNSHDSHNNSHENGPISFSSEHDSLNNADNHDLSNENHKPVSVDEGIAIPTESENVPSKSSTVTKTETHIKSMKSAHLKEEETPSQLTVADTCNEHNGGESHSMNSSEVDGFEFQKYGETDPSLLQPEKNSVSISSSPDTKLNHPLDSKKANSDLTKGIDIDKIMSSHLQVTQLEGHADVVFCVAVDEDIVLSSSGDTTIKVWNVDKKEEVSSFAGHNGAVTCVSLLNAGESENLCKELQLPKSTRIAVSASSDCHIKLWSVFDGQELLSLYTFNGITCVGYLESQFYVVIGTEGGKLELWDLLSGKVMHSVFAHEDSVSDLKVDECYIYSISSDGTVKVWLYEDDELTPIYTRRRKEASSNKGEFGATRWKTVSVHNDKLYLGDNSSNLKVLDWRIGRLRQFRNQLQAVGICEATFAKNNILLTSFYDSTSDSGGINVWQLPEVSYVCTLAGDVQDICSISMTEVGHNLRIVSGGHQLLIWDFDFNQPPNKSAEEAFYVSENYKIGIETDEKPMQNQRVAARSDHTSQADNDHENNSKKSWCNVM